MRRRTSSCLNPMALMLSADAAGDQEAEPSGSERRSQQARTIVGPLRRVTSLYSRSSQGLGSAQAGTQQGRDNSMEEDRHVLVQRTLTLAQLWCFVDVPLKTDGAHTERGQASTSSHPAGTSAPPVPPHLAPLGEPSSPPSRRRRKAVAPSWDPFFSPLFKDKNVKEMTTAAAANVVSTNFRRLNLKRGKGGFRIGARQKFSSAFKRKNHKNYVSRSSSCFTCGQEGHWSSQCPNNANKKIEEGLSLEFDPLAAAGDNSSTKTPAGPAPTRTKDEVGWGLEFPRNREPRRRRGGTMGGTLPTALGQKAKAASKPLQQGIQGRSNHARHAKVPALQCRQGKFRCRAQLGLPNSGKHPQRRDLVILKI